MADKIPLKANFTGADVTSLGEFTAGDTVPVASGGTGATTAAAALTNLGAAALAGNASQSFSMLNGTVAGTLSLTGASSTLGYGIGAGGTVTQATSRSTAVVFSTPKATGAITMFSAAGSATPAIFQCLNGAIAATDTVILSVKSSTNIYRVYVVGVGAGSCHIGFESVSGTAIDAPVINFAIINGASS